MDSYSAYKRSIQGSSSVSVKKRKLSLSTVKGEHSKVLNESTRDHFSVDLPRMSFLLEQGTKKIIAIMMMIMIMYRCYQSKIQV